LSRKLKQILDKIEENAQFVEKERRKVSFSLSDRKAVDAWETNLQLKQTPLATFYESWNKVNLQQMAKRATNSDKVRHITRNSVTCLIQLLWVRFVR
jgi:nucleolar complex protein 2